MVFGPLYVLFCSFIIIRSVRGTLKPNIPTNFENYESQSQSNESEIQMSSNNQHSSYFNNNSSRPSDVSMISIDIDQEKQRSNTVYSKHSIKSLNSKSSLVWSEASSKKTTTTTSSKIILKVFSCNLQWFIYLYRYITSTIYLYRRIVFLIVVSLLSLSSAIIIANTILNLDSYTQENFYNCILRTTAFRIYSSEDDYINKCGGQDKRTSISWKIFILQLYMISFGIGPYFAFGTTQHSFDISYLCMKLNLFFKPVTKFINYFVCCLCLKKNKLKKESEKGIRPTERSETLSLDELRKTRKTDDFLPGGMLSESSDTVIFSPFEGQLIENSRPSAHQRRSFAIKGTNCDNIEEEDIDDD